MALILDPAPYRLPLILVIAPNYDYYVEWCHSHGLNDRDGNIVRFINHPEKLRGYDYENVRVIIGVPFSLVGSDRFYSLFAVAKDIQIRQTMHVDHEVCRIMLNKIREQSSRRYGTFDWKS